MNVIDLLEEMGVEPKRVASCRGGEYHSPCPDSSCGGNDRFHVWPQEGSDGRYWCRKCERSGDAIQFCRDFMGMDFPTACKKVGRQPIRSTSNPVMRPREKFTPKVLAGPLDVWSRQAIAFVQQSHQFLLDHSYLLNQDRDRGLTEQSIKDFQLGWNPSIIFENRKLWGLSNISEDGKATSLCLPQGIVIPSFCDNIPVRIKIRRHNWQPDDDYPKYHIVAGGLTCPCIYGNVNLPLVIVEAELDAMLIQQVASDICCSIALGGVSIRPDNVIDQLLRKTSTILFALDFDEAGNKAYRFWKSTYSHIEPWPVPRGKSPGDAHLEGVNLRDWIKAGIRQK